ncbi:AI-2E family transporter [Pseudoruegeria sp. SHC-113]|uniref:AI-2E family transporter n=1 Tax=Pseudoruegeria sp. SHC-113 TaxID=2855439 RepID=UPI0021BBAAE6|nr:AI-2E family transporter [Pseudoruegeria sp. SHC-113]MCT8158873.1 AI-2E family transporter [Pseudoruegeria sp. SHC-113]
MSGSAVPIRLLTLCAIVIALAAGGWMLNVAAGIVIPIILGGLVAFLLNALATSAKKIPVIGPLCPFWLRMSVSFLLTFAVLLVFAALLARNVEQVARDASSYGEAFSNMLNSLAARFGYEADVTWHSLQDLFAGRINMQDTVRYGVGAITNAIVYVFLIFIYALFFLLEARYFDIKMERIFRTADTRRRAQFIMHQMIEKVGDYMALKTLVNVMLGAICFAILFLFGIDYAAFWAILTGAFNYIPYVGSLVAVLLPVFVSVGQYESMDTTLSLAACLIVAQNIVGYYIEPRLLGKQLNMSPLVIMISLAAWGAMWGIAGAILSVPLTSMMIILFAAFPGTRPLAVMLSEDGFSRDDADPMVPEPVTSLAPQPAEDPAE